MQKEVGPIEEQEEQLLDAIARTLVLVAKELSQGKTEENNKLKYGETNTNTGHKNHN